MGMPVYMHPVVSLGSALLVAAAPTRGVADVKYLTDLSLCKPASALRTSPREGCWQLIPYETVDDPNMKAGTMVGAASYVEAPDITLPLGLSGWHAVYLGFWNPYHAYDGGTTIKARLTGDPGFVRIKEPEPRLEYEMKGSRYVSHTSLKEVFLTNADLTGRDLVLGKVCGPFGEKLYVAYVKLVPLSPEEVTALQAQRAQTDARTLVGSIDGISYFWGNEYRKPEHLLELVEPFRNSQVGKIIWAVNYGETTNYPSTVGTLWRAPGEPAIEQSTNAYVKGEKVAGQSLTSYLERGIVPEEVVGQRLHEMGVQFDIMFRLGIAGFDLLPPRRGAKPKGFLASHPECRMALADGTRVEKASYAYPPVRAFMLSLIEEAAKRFDVDGVCLCFVRGPEFLGYDPPVLEAFRLRYGEDATAVGFDDPRLRTVRSEFLTRFVHDVRRVVTEVGRTKGKQLTVSAWVYGSANQNLDYGFDVVTWINEGLLDSVIGANDPEIAAAAQAHACRLTSAVWDIDGSADTAEGRSRDSREVRDRAQDVSIRLTTVGGIDVGQGYWDTAFSGG
ncbi:MAG: hypothetical protein FJX75_29650 [Armatimonadetes bacterium]|nr:hypothetical protein [Armatimonadota bacterium]